MSTFVWWIKLYPKIASKMVKSKNRGEKNEFRQLKFQFGGFVTAMIFVSTISGWAWNVQNFTFFHVTYKYLRRTWWRCGVAKVTGLERILSRRKKRMTLGTESIHQVSRRTTILPQQSILYLWTAGDCPQGHFFRTWRHFFCTSRHSFFSPWKLTRRYETSDRLER